MIIYSAYNSLAGLLQICVCTPEEGPEDRLRSGIPVALGAFLLTGGKKRGIVSHLENRNFQKEPL
jgi:hypothetical protein